MTHDDAKFLRSINFLIAALCLTLGIIAGSLWGIRGDVHAIRTHIEQQAK